MEQKKQRRDEELLQKIILRVKELRRLHDHQSQEELAEATGLGIAQLGLGRKGNYHARLGRPVNGSLHLRPCFFFAGRSPYAASGYGSGDEFFSP